MFKIQNLIFTIIFVFISILMPPVANAAILYLSPKTQEVHIGDTFIQEVRLTTDEVINAVEAHITFPRNLLEVIDFSTGESDLTIWAKEPVINNVLGSLFFIGGVPQGLSGDLKLGKIIFRVYETPQADTGQKDINIAEIKFQDNSLVLLNDGLGTKARLEVQKADIEILAQIPEVVQNQWQEEIKKDNLVPEPFQPLLSQDITMFKDTYFLIFSTTDKQIGIDHYEVKEGERTWQIAKSPYLLLNQELQETIQVKAIDKAGNERIESITTTRTVNRIVTPQYWLLFLILLLFVIGLIAVYLARKKCLKK